MTQAKLGDTVQVHYTGRLDNETIFDSSRERQPLVYTIGKGQVIDGFDEVVLGMTVGETRKTRILPEKAYGPHLPEMVMEVERRHFPPEIVPELGLKIQLGSPSGEPVMVTITSISGDIVTLDANPPLAGKVLNFEIELIGIM